MWIYIFHFVLSVHPWCLAAAPAKKTQPETRMPTHPFLKRYKERFRKRSKNNIRKALIWTEISPLLTKFLLTYSLLIYTQDRNTRQTPFEDQRKRNLKMVNKLYFPPTQHERREPGGVTNKKQDACLRKRKNEKKPENTRPRPPLKMQTPISWHVCICRCTKYEYVSSFQFASKPLPRPSVHPSVPKNATARPPVRKEKKRKPQN